MTKCTRHIINSRCFQFANVFHQTDSKKKSISIFIFTNYASLHYKATLSRNFVNVKYDMFRIPKAELCNGKIGQIAPFLDDKSRRQISSTQQRLLVKYRFGRYETKVFVVGIGNLLKMLESVNVWRGCDEFEIFVGKTYFSMDGLEQSDSSASQETSEIYQVMKVLEAQSVGCGFYSAFFFTGVAPFVRLPPITSNISFLSAVREK